MLDKEVKSERNPILQSRWIIVEEEIPVEEEGEALSKEDSSGELTLVGSNTQVCAHFDDKEMAEFSLNSLIEVEAPEDGDEHLVIKTDSGFISVGERRERVCYITSLH